MIGLVTLLTIAAVTGSRNSSGCRGGLALHDSRLSETSMRMRFRISEVDAVADADKQPRGVAYFQSGGILAQLGTAFDLEYVAMALIVDVTVRSIEDRRIARIGDFTLEQNAGSGSPGPKHRKTGDVLPTEHIVGRCRVIPYDDLVEVIRPQQARAQQLYLVGDVVALCAGEFLDAAGGRGVGQFCIEHVHNGLEALTQLLEGRYRVRRQ